MTETWYGGATYTQGELRSAIARARRHRRSSSYCGFWGVLSSEAKEGLIAAWPTEDAANEQRDEVNAISNHFGLKVRYRVEALS